MGGEDGGKIKERHGSSCISLPRQVEMAIEQYFVHIGRMEQIEMIGKRWTTK